MMGFTTHTLPAMTLSAARTLRATCPQHGQPANGCRTTWDAKTGKDMARLTFSCGCHGLATIGAKR